MKHMVLATTLALAVLAGPASAQNSRYASPPPIVLSPDLTEPWVMQLRPGTQPIYRAPPPKATTATMRLPDPSRQLETMPVQPPGQTAKRADPRGQIDPRFLPTVVDYSGPHGPGTIIIDTEARHLFLVERDGRARRYGVGVGRPGFQWAGTHRVTRKAEWPSWRPPAEMRKRQPYLPVFMEGGPRNPLGARALYLGSTLYRIHGTSEPWTIGHAVSSGCIRMRNEDVTDLYERVPVGARVVVVR
ncbi:L,D-transpeptidase [Methylobrevis sp. L22]|uniref:L,D-transpeptidase n=2 Tax=Methylobrevis albus TaxID=2793297 RepID=A0A931I111_9HYPH|nr:L,D-transpeptidase [Methylobrevis albus]MBH0238215.1 L,D-transpeptidase [Methylobrevis albus]